MWTHALVIPFIQLYVTACDWLTAGAAPPRGLIWFLSVGFFSGIVIEIGRKIRAPEDEERGVETYSALWGRKGAVLAWLAASALTAAAALLAANRVDATVPLAGLLGILLSSEAIVARRFLRRPTTNRARLIERLAALGTLCIYLGLCSFPLLLQV
jgi:4-hydroxybenzoate polyprenyltransferase